MLRVFAAVLVDNRLILYDLVLLAESNVAVGVQLSDVLGEVLDMHRVMELAVDVDRVLKIDIGQALRLVRIVQIVIVGMEAFSVLFKGTKE